MAKPRFELFTGTDDQTYFRLRSANGKIVAHSEGYKSRSAARRGIAALVTAVDAGPATVDTNAE